MQGLTNMHIVFDMDASLNKHYVVSKSLDRSLAEFSRLALDSHHVDLTF